MLINKYEFEFCGFQINSPPAPRRVRAGSITLATDEEFPLMLGDDIERDSGDNYMFDVSSGNEGETTPKRPKTSTGDNSKSPQHQQQQNLAVTTTTVSTVGDSGDNSGFRIVRPVAIRASGN
jgi:hypothetical protein